MRKIIFFLLILSLSVTSVFASAKYGVSANLGITPGISFTSDREVFEFEAEARLLGGHISLTTDVLPSDKHDLDLGFGVGVTKNLLVDMLSGILTLGKAKSTWYCTMDFMVKYTLNAGKHSGFFLETGIPLCIATLTNEKFEPQFILADEDGLKETGLNALLYNTKIGYKYTF